MASTQIKLYWRNKQNSRRKKLIDEYGLDWVRHQEAEKKRQHRLNKKAKEIVINPKESDIDQFVSQLSKQSLNKTNYVKEQNILKAGNLSKHLRINGHNILIYPDEQCLESLNTNDIKLLVLNKESFNTIQTIRSDANIETVVVDASVPFSVRSEISDWCVRNKINFHDTNIQGYYTLQFNTNI